MVLDDYEFRGYITLQHKRILDEWRRGYVKKEDI